MTRIGSVHPGETRDGIVGSRLVQSMVLRLAQELHLPTEEENLILGTSMGASAVASEGEERRRKLLTALENALDTRSVSGASNPELEPWQRAIDWNTSILLRKRLIERGSDAADDRVFDLSQLMHLWRSTSPFTERDGEFPQYEFQTSLSPLHVEVLAGLVSEELERYSVSTLTVHKALRWESENESIPLSRSRPDWYVNPSRDAVNDGFDEEELDTEMALGTGFLANYGGFILDREAALDAARYDAEGERTPYYALLSMTVDARAVVSIPSLGFGSLAKGEVVLDRRRLATPLDQPAFTVLLGRAS